MYFVTLRSKVKHGCKDKTHKLTKLNNKSIIIVFIVYNRLTAIPKGEQTVQFLLSERVHSATIYYNSVRIKFANPDYLQT